ncbi:unnamed protein product [Dracunculus medinensis]|uniref:VWFD domain-containing protein n=1 Tax=Dracunculus medinensis TaxID=318479 RepID=A0A0N4UCL9_DRAME|nr:unnamed protein product [Dracunculus medinensis]
MGEFRLWRVCWKQTYHSRGVETWVELHCDKEYFEIVLELANSTISNYVRLSSNINKTYQNRVVRHACHSEIRKEVNQLKLKAFYQNCDGIRTKKIIGGVQYDIKIDYHLSSNIEKYSFLVTCFVPTKMIDLNTTPFNMTMTTGSGILIDSPQKTLEVGTILNFIFEPQENLSFPVNFGGYPMSCEIMKSDGSAKKDMIVNGCPSMINNIGRKAKLIQNIENLSITKCPRASHLCFGRSMDFSSEIFKFRLKFKEITIQSQSILKIMSNQYSGSPLSELCNNACSMVGEILI